MTKRGEYRSIHTVLLDSPEFMDLGPDGQLVFFHLKLRLGPSGIDALPGARHILKDCSGLTLKAIDEGVSKAIRMGFLCHQGNVYWLRNALRFEPLITLSNDKHRKGVQRHIEGLPKLSIVNDFAAYYGLESPFEIDTHKIPIGIPFDTHSNQGEGRREKGEGKREQEEGRREKEGAGERDKKPKGNGVAETAEFLQANELLGFWIDQQISKPATPQIAKQGAAAKRICLAYSREQVVQAAVGISQLFPYSGGEPWDLFDLERKFAKAMEAANNNPDVKIQRDIQHTLEILGGVPNA